MKKIIVFISSLILMSVNVVLADEGMWSNFGDQNVYGQQAVTQQDFEKALESKKQKGIFKKKDKNIPKGENFSQSNETDMINEISHELPILSVPLNLKIKDDYVIPIGYYQAEGEKDEQGNVYIKLYQAHDLIAKIPAEETNDDFGEPTIYFVKLLPHGDYHVELIYGGMDFNAYTIIDIE